MKLCEFDLNGTSWRIEFKNAFLRRTHSAARSSKRFFVASKVVGLRQFEPNPPRFAASHHSKLGAAANDAPFCAERPAGSTASPQHQQSRHSGARSEASNVAENLAANSPGGQRFKASRSYLQ